MRVPAALVALALASAPAAAEVVVRVSGGHVELTATAAPLADVLDRLARQTGMKVVYEGAAPRQLVTLSLHGRTPTETILSVFEGLGVNFALVADPSGSRVQTLVVAGTATASSSPSSAGDGRLASPATGAPAVRPSTRGEPGNHRPRLRGRRRGARGRRGGLRRGCPRGRRFTDPGGTSIAPPDPALANPAAQVPPPGGRAGPRRSRLASPLRRSCRSHSRSRRRRPSSHRRPPRRRPPAPDDSGTPTSPPPP